jgi:hypothetical protein
MRESGEGGPPCVSRAVGGVSDSPIVRRRQRSSISDAPSTTLRAVPLPRCAGEDKQIRSRDAFASEFCHAIPKQALPSTSPKKGGGAPTGAPTIGRASGRGRAPCAGALASRRSTAALATQINAMAQPRPRFARNSGQRRYLRHESRLQRCTSRAGHYAGRVDAQTARERGYKPRPQEPHSPHQSAVTGRRPFDERDSMRLSNGSGDGCQGRDTVSGTK